MLKYLCYPEPLRLDFCCLHVSDLTEIRQHIPHLTLMTMTDNPVRFFSGAHGALVYAIIGEYFFHNPLFFTSSSVVFLQ